MRSFEQSPGAAGMRSESPGPTMRLLSRLQDAADPRTDRPRRARLFGRAPLQDVTTDRRNGIPGQCCSALNDTPGISTLMQKAEKLSLNSALPPAKNPLSKAARACEVLCSPSPQPAAHNPKRKLYESPAGDLAYASSGGSARRRSQSAPRKRRCGLGGTGPSLSMPSLPAALCRSPLPGLRSCISAPEPELQAAAADDAMLMTPQPSARTHFGPGFIEYAQAQDIQTAMTRSPLQVEAGALLSQAQAMLQGEEGSQDDTLSSASRMLAAATPIVGAPIAALPIAAPVSLLPQVENASIGLPSIEPETLAALLAGQHKRAAVPSVLIVDCRYAYEHAGGCVAGALNIQEPGEMEALTLDQMAIDWATTAVVLYCEFSSERGPRMFRHIRNMDRRRHLAAYPALAVPHMYVMSGGYKAFQESYPDLCTPRGGYVRMSDSRFDRELKEQHSRAKAAWCNKDARKKTALPRLS